MVEGRTHKPIIQPERCHTCDACLRGCPAEFIPEYRKKEGTVPIQLKEALVNEDDNPLWTEFNIVHIPTLIAFKNGKVIARADALPGAVQYPLS
jgi:ferredoxin